MKEERRIITMYAVQIPTYATRPGKPKFDEEYYASEEEAKRVSEACGYTYRPIRAYADTFGL